MRYAIPAALAVTFLWSIGLFFQVPGLNGAWFAPWLWRDQGFLKALAFLAPPLLLFAFAQFESRKLGAGPSPRREAAKILAALVACNLLWQAGALLVDPRAPGLLRTYVETPWVMGYFTDALEIRDLRGWLAGFHQEALELHSNTHPPGPILHFYFWIRLLGREAAPYAGAVAMGFVASSGIPVLYRFAALWTPERLPRLTACAFYSLLPALIVFFPQYDQSYPVLMMLMVLFWSKALDGRMACATAFGAVLFVSTLFAYNLLTVGAAIVLIALVKLRTGAAWKVAAKAAALALATTVGLHAALAASVGYRIFASFAHALQGMEGLNERLGRTWSRCVVFDLYDFALGGGLLIALLAVIQAARPVSDPEERRRRILTLVGFASILVVDLTGLLRAEAARVWLFLQPWVVVPAGLEASRLSIGRRAWVFGVAWLTLVVMVTKMTFLILEWPS